MALRKNAKVELIKRIPLFSQCTRREVEAIAAIADEVDVRAGKELTKEGRPGREFFVLVEGEADVLRNGRKVATMGKGDFFGEISLIAKRPRTATVVARTPSEVLVVTERSFNKLLEDSPTIQNKVLRALAERVARDLR